MNVAILIDEMNAMHQLQMLGIHGLNTWKSFFNTIKRELTNDFNNEISVDYHFYGCLPPEHYDRIRYHDRKRFFTRLQHDGIHVHQGLCLVDQGNLREKGIDLMIGLDLYEFSLNHYDLLFLFSGDADLIPAIERAKKHSKVVTILCKHMISRHVRNAADGVLYLEKLLEKDQNNLIKGRVS